MEFLSGIGVLSACQRPHFLHGDEIIDHFCFLGIFRNQFMEIFLYRTGIAHNSVKVSVDSAAVFRVKIRPDGIRMDPGNLFPGLHKFRNEQIGSLIEVIVGDIVKIRDGNVKIFRTVSTQKPPIKLL